MKKIFGIVIFFLTANPGVFAAIISPEGVQDKIEWNQEDQAKNLAVQKIAENDHLSHHVIRLQGAERPHTHQTHDLTVFVLKGEAEMFLKDQKYPLKSGDVVRIPKGTVHWARNLGREASEVFAVFVPPYDGLDHHEEENP